LVVAVSCPLARLHTANQTRKRLQPGSVGAKTSNKASGLSGPSSGWPEPGSLARPSRAGVSNTPLMAEEERALTTDEEERELPATSNSAPTSQSKAARCQLPPVVHLPSFSEAVRDGLLLLAGCLSASTSSPESSCRRGIGRSNRRLDDFDCCRHPSSERNRGEELEVQV
jgi:hypothetical protein